MSKGASSSDGAEAELEELLGEEHVRDVLKAGDPRLDLEALYNERNVVIPRPRVPPLDNVAAGHKLLPRSLLGKGGSPRGKAAPQKPRAANKHDRGAKSSSTMVAKHTSPLTKKAQFSPQQKEPRPTGPSVLTQIAEKAGGSGPLSMLLDCMKTKAKVIVWYPDVTRQVLEHAHEQLIEDAPGNRSTNDRARAGVPKTISVLFVRGDSVVIVTRFPEPSSKKPPKP